MNNLAHETSVYLRDHAVQPVEWHPWGEEAWARARTEDKPVFLSIGYSSCHWCHVMARESFSDARIAELLNQNFVCIKVDREERPEVDELYLEAVRLLNGSAGWPLSVFLTPNLKPFYGGTYFPPEPSHYLPSFRRVLESVLHHFRTERQEIEAAGDTVVKELDRLSGLPDYEGEIRTMPLELYYRQRLETFDSEHGGFGIAPKFPSPNDLLLLLRLSRRPGFERALPMIELTLSKMAQGGIYDHVGGGFHRYSTDTVWLVPHFEKMLYDNALLAQTYAEAFGQTGNQLYRSVSEGTLDYLVRELRSPEGGFYAAQDADTDGQEGAHYVWTRDEIDEALGPELAVVAAEFYGVTQLGNFHGKNVLHLTAPAETRFGDGPLAGKLEAVRARLRSVRDARGSLRRDEKVLADWNGLAMSALARGYRAFGSRKYLEIAVDLGHYIRKRLIRERDLLHLERRGQSDLAGGLADYALVVQGFLDLYEAGFGVDDAGIATELADRMIELFYDPEGGFYATRAQEPGLITRAKGGYDGAIPSGNSTAALSLLRLARLTGATRYERTAVDTVRRSYRTMLAFPTALPRMLTALDYLLSPGTDLVVVLPETGGGPDEFQEWLRLNPDPYRTTVLVRGTEPGEEAENLIPLIRGRVALDNRPTAYFCQDSTCSRPVHTVGELDKLLKRPTSMLDTGAGSA